MQYFTFNVSFARFLLISKFETMSAIDLTNVTPIPIDDLKSLFRCAAKKIDSIKGLRLDKYFFLTAGIAIASPKRIQPFQGRDELIAKQKECALALRDVVKPLRKGTVTHKPLPEWVEAEKERKALAQSKSAKQKYARRKLTEQDELQKLGISLKTPESIDRKALDDYGKDGAPDYSRIMDYVRCTLYVKDAKDIVRLSNQFRPCNNPNTIYFENSFACKNDKTGVRRLMINYKLPNGCIAEIQVVHAEAEKAYLRSHDAYRKERAVKDAGSKTALRGQFDPSTSKALGKVEGSAHQERVTTNEKINQDLGLNGLVLQRSFASIDGFPVMRVYNPFTLNTFTVVPNPITGFYEIDDRFLKIIDNPDKFKDKEVKTINRDTFITRSTALLHSNEARNLILEHAHG